MPDRSEPFTRPDRRSSVFRRRRWTVRTRAISLWKHFSIFAFHWLSTSVTRDGYYRNLARLLILTDDRSGEREMWAKEADVYTYLGFFFVQPREDTKGNGRAGVEEIRIVKLVLHCGWREALYTRNINERGSEWRKIAVEWEWKWFQWKEERSSPCCCRVGNGKWLRPRLSLQRCKLAVLEEKNVNVWWNVMQLENCFEECNYFDGVVALGNRCDVSCAAVWEKEDSPLAMHRCMLGNGFGDVTIWLDFFSTKGSKCCQRANRYITTVGNCFECESDCWWA